MNTWILHIKFVFLFSQTGNGLPDLQTQSKAAACMEKVGFKLIECEDVAKQGTLPWYASLQGTGAGSFRAKPIGMKMTHASLKFMEAVKLVPKGSTKVHKMLTDTAVALIKAGELGIFSPGLLMVGLKEPADKK